MRVSPPCCQCSEGPSDDDSVPLPDEGSLSISSLPICRSDIGFSPQGSQGSVQVPRVCLLLHLLLLRTAYPNGVNE